MGGVHGVPVRVVVDPYTGPAGMLIRGSRDAFYGSVGFVYSFLSMRVDFQGDCRAQFSSSRLTSVVGGGDGVVFRGGRGCQACMEEV